MSFNRSAVPWAMTRCRALGHEIGKTGCAASLLADADDRTCLAATDPVIERAGDVMFSLWEGPAPECVRSGSATTLGDLSDTRDRWPLLAAEAERLHIGAWAVVPIALAHRSVLGLVSAYRDAARPFSQRQLGTMALAARRLSGELVAAVLGPDEGEDDVLPASDVGLAAGMVQHRFDVAHHDAVAMLRAHAFALGVTVRELADAVVRREVSTADVGD